MHTLEALEFLGVGRDERGVARLRWRVASASCPGSYHLFSCRLDGSAPACTCKAWGRCTLRRNAPEAARRHHRACLSVLTEAELRAADARLTARAKRDTLGALWLAYDELGDELAMRGGNIAGELPRKAA